MRQNHIINIYIKVQITNTACKVPFYITIMEYDLEIISVSWTINSTFGVNSTLWANRPFPNYIWPLFQSETWCSSLIWKLVFIHMQMKTNFHMKSWAPGLALKKRVNVIRKRPILCYSSEVHKYAFDIYIYWFVSRVVTTVFWNLKL